MYSFSTKGIRSKRIHIEANGLRIPLLILKPLSEPENAPGVMWIHGGGYMTGMGYIKGSANWTFFAAKEEDEANPFKGKDAIQVERY